MSVPDAAVQAVSQRLDSFVDAQRVDAAGMGTEAGGFIDAAATALAGGKRLRARFCLTGWRAVAEHAGVREDSPPASVVDAAASLEIFHAAALVHDDIVDNSDTRRGRPAAHRRLEQHHRDAGWAADPAEFGRSAALLLGDLLVAWSDDLLEQGLRTSLRDGADPQPAREVYARMRREVTVGQFLDIAEEAAYLTAPDADLPERALRIASLKSARYSVQHPLLLGAALAGADAAQEHALSSFGHPLGMAFQLRDDVLGVFGDATVTGKPSGDDLREGKRTLLIAFTREHLSAGARTSLDELVGDPGLTDEQIAMLQQTIVSTGALARVEELITRYGDEADRALRGAPLGTHAVGVLRDLARAAVVRAA